MTTKTVPMDRLKKRLQEVGIDHKYLKNNILPDWWDDSIPSTPAGLAELHGYLYTRAGIDLHSLDKPDAPVRFVKRTAKFKKVVSVAKDELTVAKSLGLSVAAKVARGARVTYRGILGPVADIRKSITRDGETTVNLDTLLAYCWDAGVPVVHLGNFPQKAKKMEGMTAMVDGRPVIVLSKNQKSPAWQVFILAHEMGHVFHGHLDNVDLLVDYKLEQAGDDDEEEKAANLFALELLTGSPGMTFSSDYLVKASILASEAERLGKKLNIEPGVIILNYGKTKGCWPLANAALKLVETTDSAIELIHRRMVAKLNAEAMGEENHEWILSITGADQHA